MPAGRLQRAGQPRKQPQQRPGHASERTTARPRADSTGAVDVVSTGLSAAGSDLSSTVASLSPERLTVPGRTGQTITLSPDALTRLLGPAIVVAAGLDPAITPDPPRPVLWTDGANRLLVHLDAARVACGNGFTDVVIGVQCDQTQAATVCSTFVTSSPEKPGGFVWATEHRPRGPEIVVTIWGDALVALAWRALVEITRVVCGVLGHDAFGRPLVPATVVATTDGWLLTPMAPPRLSSLTARA